MRRPGRVLLVAGALALGAGGCATSTAALPPPASSGVVRVVAAESVWGGLAAQLGGAHATVTSIIASPDADPHDYEPTAADARALAHADLTIVNGVGYDAWASKLLAVDPRRTRTSLDVGRLVGVPRNGNPHRWYDPRDVRTVIDAITASYVHLDPADAAAFEARRTRLLTVTLSPYFQAIATLRTRYAGTPVAASESLFAPLAEALGLRLVTPASFLNAISEGTDPTARDKALIDGQLRRHEVQLYVENSQNATPDVQAQVLEARAAGVPVVTVTETPTPAGTSFQVWQVAQLTRIGQALAEGTAR